MINYGASHSHPTIIIQIQNFWRVTQITLICIEMLMLFMLFYVNVYHLVLVRFIMEWIVMVVVSKFQYYDKNFYCISSTLFHLYFRCVVPLEWCNIYLVKRPRIGHKERYEINLCVGSDFISLIFVMMHIWLICCRYLAYSKRQGTLNKWFTNFETFLFLTFEVCMSKHKRIVKVGFRLFGRKKTVRYSWKFEHKINLEWQNR